MKPGFRMLAALAVIYAGYAVQEFVVTAYRDAPRTDRPAPAADGTAMEQAGRRFDPVVRRVPVAATEIEI